MGQAAECGGEFSPEPVGITGRGSERDPRDSCDIAALHKPHLGLPRPEGEPSQHSQRPTAGKETL